MKSLQELIDESDPAWPALRDAIRESANGAEVLPAADGAGAKTLTTLQVTTRSTLGALAFETGGLFVRRGWLRVLGASGPRMANGLIEWNSLEGGPRALPNACIAGFDAAGGVFAINGGEFSGPPGKVFFLSPLSLEWEPCGFGHSGFVEWALDGALDKFYAGLEWPGWEADLARATPDQAFHAYPPPWTKEGKNPATVSRKTIAARELFAINLDMRRQLGGL